MRVFSQPAYTLISRPYSETSLIVEVFSREYGRVGLMAKGARRLKSKYKGVLQPFQPLLLSWAGRGEVPTLTSAEINPKEFNLFRHQLRGDALVCGFYCNELLVNLLHRHDPHQGLFDDYHQAIISLNTGQQQLADALRGFEQKLMKETGYEVSFLTEADGKTHIEDVNTYRFQPHQGFIRVPEHQRGAVSGRVIKSLHGADATNAEPEIATKAKQLMREVLAQTLGNKRIISRDLFLPRQRSD
ncbi:MAG: DNA repair protein RecO [Acidiferrobacterales bacterium]|nr:DNA repair protein RecO [Acidiferrobacterales bacterium]